jgi:hypothetical protein
LLLSALALCIVSIDRKYLPGVRADESAGVT